MRKPQDAVVSNVKRLRAEVRALAKRVHVLERAYRDVALVLLIQKKQAKSLRK